MSAGFSRNCRGTSSTTALSALSFFFNDTAPTEIYTLSLHDALPILLPMTRLSGGRDGIDAITPEDFIGLDTGPGERTGLLGLAAQEEVALLAVPDAMRFFDRSEEHTSELQSQFHLVCRLLLEKKKQK